MTTGAAEVSPRCAGAIAGALEDVEPASWSSWSWSSAIVSAPLSALVLSLGWGR